MTTCTRCDAPQGYIVTRRRSDPSIWALDLDLAEEFPGTWDSPDLVILEAGACGRCTAEPKARRPRRGTPFHRPTRQICRGRNTKGGLCNAVAVTGSGFCARHQESIPTEERKAG